MTVSELIDRLLVLSDEHGPDLPVVVIEELDVIDTYAITVMRVPLAGGPRLAVALDLTPGGAK